MANAKARVPRASRYMAHKKAKKTTHSYKRKAPSMRRSRKVGRRMMKHHNPEADKCFKDFQQSLINPFDTTLAPCLPTFPAVPSERLTAYTRVTASVGTNGFGFVMATPNIVSSTTTLIANVMYSSSAFTGTATTATLPTTGVVGAAHNATGYSPSQGVQEYRLVSMGIRAVYTGQDQTRSGIFLCHHDPQNDTLIGATEASLTGNDKVAQEATDDKWHSVIYLPVKPSDFEFISATVSPAVYPLCIVFVGTAANTYSVEVVWHWEVIGTGARGKMQSHSHSDATENYIGSVNNLPQSYISKLLNQAAENAIPIAALAASAYLTGGGGTAAALR